MAKAEGKSLRVYFRLKIAEHRMMLDELGNAAEGARAETIRFAFVSGMPNNGVHLNLLSARLTAASEPCRLRQINIRGK
jgi:hypothetical protein